MPTKRTDLLSSNTLKTAAGFLQSLVKRRLPLARDSQSVEEIYNYLRIDGQLSTSGQPSAQELGLIRDAGFTTVINLAPNSILENAVVEERRILESLGLSYVHIPVDFTNPSEADFDAFVAAMQAHAAEQVWVHCAANMRVSAFVYRYRVAVQGVEPVGARRDLDMIWNPVGVWRNFIER